MEWWVGLLLALFVCGLTIVGLLWWIRLPKATSISIEGQHVIITGSSSGIGLALARLVVAEGAHVSLIARDPVKLAAAQASVQEYCKQKHAGKEKTIKVNTYSADVKDFASMKKAFEAACNEAGSVVVLVLSHGVSVPGTFEETSIETMEHILDTNLKGNIHSIKAALHSSCPASLLLLPLQSSLLKLVRLEYMGMQHMQQVSLHCGDWQRFYNKSLFPVISAFLSYFLLILILLALLKGVMDVVGRGQDQARADKEAFSIIKIIACNVSSKKYTMWCEGRAGQFSIACNFDRLMLSVVGAGMSPQPSFPLAILEVMTMGFFCIVALFVLRGWYDTICSSTNLQQQKCKK